MTDDLMGTPITPLSHHTPITPLAPADRLPVTVLSGFLGISCIWS